MFFHSLTSSSKPNLMRRPTITGQTQLQVGQFDQRLTAQFAEALQRGGAAPGETATIRRSTGTGGGGAVAVELPIPIVASTSSDRRRRSRQISIVANAEVDDLLFGDGAPMQRGSVDLSQLQAVNNNVVFHPDLSQSSPVDSLFSISEARRLSKTPLVGLGGGGRTHTVILRRPTITIHEDGRIQIDHVTARWDGTMPMSGQAAGLLDIDDGATIITDTLKEDLTDGVDAKSCPQQVVKYLKILTPHIILVSVLVGYLCLGAWILMMLETRTELMARSRKLVRIANLMTNFTADSWRLVNDAQTGVSSIHHSEWEQAFREYMTLVAENVDDRRPIRNELRKPDSLENMHNKWTFPTSLLYVLTVLTTCGYGEVSVDTDTGKVFSVVFALVGIPLMFITAADIGKFLSETLLRFVKNWNLMTKRVNELCTKMFCKKKYVRRKSLQSASGQLDGLGMIGGLDGAEEKLWFPIGAYVACICLYCSMGSVMFISWEHKWSFIHAFHFGFNLIVTVGLGDIVVTDYVFLSLIVAFVIVGLSVVTMCVDLASTHLKAYFTRIHYFGRAKRFLGMSEELKEIVALLGAMRKKKNGKVTWNDVRDFLDNELRDRPFEPHELLMKLRFIDETTSSGMSTIRHNSFQSDFFRDNEYLRRLTALRPEQPAYLSVYLGGPRKKVKFDSEQSNTELKTLRKRKSYSIKTKLEVVDYAKEYSKNAASKKFNISRSIVQSWVKQEKELQEYLDSSPGTSAKQRLQGAGRHLCFAELDKELAEWVQQQHDHNFQISRKMLKQQAEKMFVEHNNKGIQFKASEGWLQKFMFRHNLCTRDPTSPAPPVDTANTTRNTDNPKPAEEYEQVLIQFIKEQILYKEDKSL